jgi:hypothetical protein
MQKTNKEIRFAKVRIAELREKRIFLCNSLKGIVPAYVL